MKTIAVLLAAGQGKRMHSQLPKVLHLLGGKPLIWHAFNALREASQEPPMVVIGHGADAVRQAVEEMGEAQFAVQEQRLGTGHAVQQTEALLKGKSDLVLVVSADMPLLGTGTLLGLIETQKENEGPLTMLTVRSDEARGFGRVVRDKKGQIEAIVEEAQATPEQLTIDELNVGAYCIQSEWLWPALKRIPLSPKGEYYLTDLVGIAVDEGLAVAAINLEDPADAIGVNTRVHLAEAEATLRVRINQRWMLAGVTLIDPHSTYIEPEVVIGQDTTIHPNTALRGKTRVGSECQLGPNTVIADTTIGDRCLVQSSVLEEAMLENDVDVGPFGHLRKGTHLADGVHMGNYGEVKKAYLGPGTKIGHFSYIGDATIGANVNIGAGTITCNYDGEKKHHTTIEDGVFIGSDTMLVAPLTIGEGARTGAGSVVTKDVPPHTVVVGVPARAIRKLKARD